LQHFRVATLVVGDVVGALMFFWVLLQYPCGAQSVHAQGFFFFFKMKKRRRIKMNLFFFLKK
jgi:hypothetical protein